MKIRFNSDADLPLKERKMYDIVIVIRSVFNDNNKYYPQILLDKFFYKLTEYILFKCYILIKMMFMKVLMLMRQVHLKSLLFVIIFIFQEKSLGFNHLSVTDVMN